MCLKSVIAHFLTVNIAVFLCDHDRSFEGRDDSVSRRSIVFSVPNGPFDLMTLLCGSKTH